MDTRQSTGTARRYIAAIAEPCTRRYLHGPTPGSDNVLAEETVGTSGNTLQWFLADHQGGIRDVIDSSGGSVDHIVYDSFGRIISRTSTSYTLYGNTGRELAPESGTTADNLYYYRRRFYDGNVGRFLSEDPISFGAGDDNLYRYVGNDPLGHTDPTGLYKEDVIWSSPLQNTSWTGSAGEPAPHAYLLPFLNLGKGDAGAADDELAPDLGRAIQDSHALEDPFDLKLPRSSGLFDPPPVTIQPQAPSPLWTAQSVAEFASDSMNFAGNALLGLGESLNPFSDTSYVSRGKAGVAGRIAGRAAGFIFGATEMAAGGALMTGGGFLTLTGFGAVVGVPAAWVGIAGIVHSVTVIYKTAEPINYNMAAPEGKYSNLPDPKNVGPDKPFTPATKKKILEQNKAANDGTIRSDESGTPAAPSAKSQSGVTPPANEAQIDHMVPRSKGGTNSPSNAQVLTRKENRAKSNK